MVLIVVMDIVVVIYSCSWECWPPFLLQDFFVFCTQLTFCSSEWLIHFIKGIPIRFSCPLSRIQFLLLSLPSIRGEVMKDCATVLVSIFFAEASKKIGNTRYYAFCTDLSMRPMFARLFGDTCNILLMQSERWSEIKSATARLSHKFAHLAHLLWKWHLGVMRCVRPALCSSSRYIIQTTPQ